MPAKNVTKVTKTVTKKAAILKSLSHGSTVTAACKAASITPKTYYQWLKDDPEFSKAHDQAQLDLIKSVESVVYGQAMEGNLRAAIFVLERKGGWEDTKHIDHQGEIKIDSIHSLVAAAAEEEKRLDDAHKDPSEVPPEPATGGFDPVKLTPPIIVLPTGHV